MSQPSCKKILEMFGQNWAPLFFMCFHIFFFVVSSIFAMICYNNFYLHCLLVCTWISISIWNGACFYMDYFARKYEANLKRLDEIQS